MGDHPNPQVLLAQINSETLDDEHEIHDKQFLVFSSAGKPIYAYHGHEEKLSSFMATAEALMSVTTDSRSESIRYIRSGRSIVAFLDRSPICLVAISNLAEPPAVLRMQLALVHGQLTSLLTASAVANIFAKSPGYDARRLLGGADIMLDSLIGSFTTSPAALLGAYPSLPLPPAVRTQTSQALQTALTSSRAAFALIVSGDAVAALACSVKQQLQQWDVLLLLNFLKSNQSLKQAETFTPICLPTYNPNGHLHAYIRFIDDGTGTAIVLLAGGPRPEFEQLSLAQREVSQTLESIGALESIKQSSRTLGTSQCRYTSLESLEIAFEGIGVSPASLLHCAYKRTAMQQFIVTSWSEAAASDSTLQQDIIISYSQLRAAMFDHAGEHIQGPLQTLRYEGRPRHSLIALSSRTSELYLALDCLVSKSEAVKIGEKLLKVLLARHDCLFF